MEVKRALSIYLRPDLIERVEGAAKADGRSVSNFVERVLDAVAPRVIGERVIVPSGVFESAPATPHQSNMRAVVRSGRESHQEELITTARNLPHTGGAISITSVEAKQIADFISPIYRDHLANYSFKKYPAAEYEGYQNTYSALQIHNPAIYDSLVWKWGHVGKENFLNAHKALIKKVEAVWPKYVAFRRGQPLKTYSAADTFQWWAGQLPKTAYITVAYITHLVHHAEDIPIIDQHNFRAMNTLIKRVRKTHAATKSPRTLMDIMRLKVFITEILVHLSNTNFGELDRFLMMFGKSEKTRKPRKQKTG